MRIEARRNPADLAAEARAYLAATDWYAIRLAETGQPVPADVAAKRAAARETLSGVAA